MTPWLISHLSSGALLAGALMAWLFAWRRGSATQRCCVIGVFLASLVVITPLQRWWWPEIAIPVRAERAKSVIPPVTIAEEARPVIPQTEVAATRPQTPVSQAAPRFSMGSVLAFIWLAGAVVLLLRLAAGWWQWRQLWRRSRACESSSVYEDMLPRDGRVEIRISDTIAVPVACGPRILMPADWEGWAKQDRIAAIEHELAHWRHRDGLTRWLTALATALHWPSPLVWMADRRLRLAQEQRCDEAVLAHGVDALSYGRLLMRCAKRIDRSHPWLPSTVASMARPKQLAERIEHLARASSSGTRPSGWSHVVWPLLPMIVCLQSLHVRLVAQAAPHEAKGHGKELIAIEVKMIGLEKGGMEKALLPEEKTGTAGYWKISQERMNPLLRSLLKDPKVSTVSYPRMVTVPDCEIMIRNVTLWPGATALLESVGKTGPGWAGTIMSFTGSLLEDGIEVNGGVGMNRIAKDLGEGQAEHEGRKLMIEKQRLLKGETLVLGPFPRAAKRGKAQGVIDWVLITPKRVTPKGDEAQEKAATALRSAPARAYKIDSRSWHEVLIQLAADAGIPMMKVDVEDSGDGAVQVDTMASPFSVFEKVCEDHGLRISLRGGLWIVHPILMLDATPELGYPAIGPPVALPPSSTVRSQPAQEYEFQKAQLKDVLYFLATDAKLSFIGLMEGAEEGERQVTFRMKDSPFTVLESVCRVNQIELTREDDIWCLRSPTGEEKERAAAAAKLRSMPAKPYAFRSAVLGDVLRYLGKDAGINCAVPEDHPRMDTLLTFSINAPPFSVMETLCKSNSLKLTLKNGQWLMK